MRFRSYHVNREKNSDDAENINVVASAASESAVVYAADTQVAAGELVNHWTRCGETTRSLIMSSSGGHS